MKTNKHSPEIAEHTTITRRKILLSLLGPFLELPIGTLTDVVSDWELCCNAELLDSVLLSSVELVEGSVVTGAMGYLGDNVELSGA